VYNVPASQSIAAVVTWARLGKAELGYTALGCKHAWVLPQDGQAKDACVIPCMSPAPAGSTIMLLVTTTAMLTAVWVSH
jgi:hypothetical protein